MNKTIPPLKTTDPLVDIKAHAVKGAFWNVFFALVNKGFTLVGQVVLAWFLLPSDMGLANTAQAMASFAVILSTGGLSDVLIQRGRYEKEAGQALWLSFAFSTITGMIICGIAFLSPALGRPAVRDLMLVLALTNFISSPLGILSAGLRNKLDFKGLAFSQFAGGVVYTASSIFLAWLGWGPYSLIVPIAPKALVTMWIVWTRENGIDLTAPQWDRIKILAKPTLSLSFSTLFTAWRFQAPVFVCGLILDPSDTGFFSWGWMVASQSVFLLATNLGQVLLPTFTKLENHPEKRARAALKAAHIMTSLLCVACGTQALLAQPLIRLFLPAKWIPAVPVVVLASLGLISQGVWTSGTSWLNAGGRYRFLLKLNALQAVLVTGLTWIGVKADGMMGATLGCALATLLGSLTCILPMGRKFLFSQILSWIRPLGLSACVWLFCRYVSLRHGPLLQIAASIVFTLLAGWIWWREDEGGLKMVYKKMAESYLGFWRSQTRAS
jgi:O-antigen/teichoic acid export membrane protein